jgi:peptide/nickel transport system substrate-binding protein
MKKNLQLLNALRKGRAEHENQLVEGLVSGMVSRREFLRFGSVVGLSLPYLGAITAAAGLSGVTPGRALAQSSGGTIRIGQVVPAAAIEPVKLADSGGVTVLSQVAETLVLSGQDLVARPLLAESWSPNKDGSVWTFKIRQGVKFHDGRDMTAKDVVASIDRIADPANGSNALSALKGVLSKGGARQVDDFTVEFQLDAPNGSFPYSLSTDNYNAVVLPHDYAGDFESNMIGTGPFKLEAYTPKVGVTFVRNDAYWGGPALPDRVEISFYEDNQAQILALQAGSLDYIKQVPILQAAGIANDPSIQMLSIPSAAHCQVHMRTDKAPFTDKRVRQAIALCLDRPAIVNGLLRGKAQVGNDSPFAAAYPSTDASVPQRQKDIAKAKELMAAEGMPGGFEVTLTAERFVEIPDYAVIIQNAVKEIGGKINLNIMDQGSYYAEAVYGNSPWLDSDMGITNYGHRGVPNVYLTAPLKSDGTWNSAHFKNKEYDSLVASYVAALDVESQKQSAGKIQTLLLDETPVLFSYFFDYVSAARQGVTGAEATAMGHLFLQRASLAT